MAVLAAIGDLVRAVRAQEAVDAERHEALRIPAEIDYRMLPGLSAELVEKLATTRPESLGQAGRIEGMTPSALSLILLAIRRAETAHAA